MTSSGVTSSATAGHAIFNGRFTRSSYVGDLCSGSTASADELQLTCSGVISSAMPLSWYASYHVAACWAVVRHSVGMSVKIEFWSAVATTVPVLGLAQVVQARTIISGWDRSIPAWYRTFQSMLWTATLVGATIAEYFTFIALAGESAPPSWAPALCRYVILSPLG